MFDQEKIALTACQSLYIDTEFNILYVQAVSQGATNAHARHPIRHHARHHAGHHARHHAGHHAGHHARHHTRHHARQIEDKHPSTPRW